MIQKFIFPSIRGVGHFEALGLPDALVLGNLVGFIEILFGTFILIGFLIRISSVMLIGVMLGAIFISKVPIFNTEGFWVGMHASRTDLSMLISCIYLFIIGGGSYSLDRYFKGLILQEDKK